jgi:leucyl-tRNA synthetase
MSKYIPSEFEVEIAKKWAQEKIYCTPPLEEINEQNKIYILSMFPYPSGDGLHVGHVRIYTGTDVMARYFRMKGKKVLHPMGWDAFGLPAENAAIKRKANPLDMVPNNIANFKRQMQLLGFSYDWEKEIATIDPEYYKWTQWLFIQFFKQGLLYKKNTPINFCPKCKTGLAEEEVLSNNTHERCGSMIEKKELPQWIFKITQYASRLLEDLKQLDWPEGILTMQKNWIGKKEGVTVKFSNEKEVIEVFTTRIDTIYGV